MPHFPRNYCEVRVITEDLVVFAKSFRVYKYFYFLYKLPQLSLPLAIGKVDLNIVNDKQSLISVMGIDRNRHQAERELSCISVSADI